MSLSLAVNQLSLLASNNKNSHKFFAYNKAINSISQLTEEEFESRESFVDLKYIGPKLNDKIIEFKRTGVIPELISRPELVKVRKGFTTIRQPLSKVLEFMNDNLSKYSDLYIVVGSVRRKSSLIADIDLIAVGDNYERLVTEMISKYQILVRGKVKTSFLVDPTTNLQLDINYSNEDNLGFSLLHHTGSVPFNVRVRQKANSLGLSLNQYGLYNKSGVKVLTSVSEEEILNYLGINYLPPELR